MPESAPSGSTREMKKQKRSSLIMRSISSAKFLLCSQKSEYRYSVFCAVVSLSPRFTPVSHVRNFQFCSLFHTKGSLIRLIQIGSIFLLVCKCKLWFPSGIQTDIHIFDNICRCKLQKEVCISVGIAGFRIIIPDINSRLVLINSLFRKFLQILCIKNQECAGYFIVSPLW